MEHLLKILLNEYQNNEKQKLNKYDRLTFLTDAITRHLENEDHPQLIQFKNFLEEMDAICFSDSKEIGFIDNCLDQIEASAIFELMTELYEDIMERQNADQGDDFYEL